MTRHYVIFNPASGRGRGRRRIERYRRLLEKALDNVTFGLSDRPGGESILAEKALREGYDVIVAVGGDGTWSGVADRIVASGRDDVAMGILPNGTGNDFGRSLGFDPADAEEAVRVLAGDIRHRVDVGCLDTLSASEHAPGVDEPRHFLNLVGFGFDVAVIDRAAEARFLKGELLYKVTALQQLFSFPGFDVSVDDGAGHTRSGSHLMLTVSNGRYFGGGFPIAPHATIVDGVLHACSIQDATPLTRLSLFNKAERGKHVTAAEVEILDSPRFQLSFPSPPRFELDGDVRQAVEATLDIRVLPRVLDVIGPKDIIS